MTDEWLDRVGQDIWQAKIDRLLKEFAYLGEENAKVGIKSEQCGERWERLIFDERNINY